MNKTKFTEKLAEKELIVERIFNGSLGIVWRAWTEAEMLDKWWGPKPWKTETIHMEFKEGGYWHYAMSSPEGEKHF